MRKIIIFLMFGFLFVYAKTIQIGTGSKNGVYYPTGVGICNILNQNGIKCRVKVTSGSVSNILHTVKSKKLSLSIAQSDIVYASYYGKGIYRTKPYRNLRTIISIYPELLTLIVNKKSHIKKLSDLLSKKDKISTGKIGSGTKSTVDMLSKEVLGIKNGRLPSSVSISIDLISDYLIQNRISGFFFVVGHPTNHIEKMCKNNSIRFINLDTKNNPKIKNLLKNHPYYAKGIIKKELYSCLNKDIVSYGVKANLIVDKNMSEKEVEKITKLILRNFDKLKKSHPALWHITKKSMLKGLGAPLHKGAKKVFINEGLL